MCKRIAFHNILPTTEKAPFPTRFCTAGTQRRRVSERDLRPVLGMVRGSSCEVRYPGHTPFNRVKTNRSVLNMSVSVLYTLTCDNANEARCTNGLIVVADFSRKTLCRGQCRHPVHRRHSTNLKVAPTPEVPPEKVQK